MKTYFKYEGLIKSKEAVEAIAAPVALGPFCGFGSVKYLVIDYQFKLKQKMVRYLKMTWQIGLLPDTW